MIDISKFTANQQSGIAWAAGKHNESLPDGEPQLTSEQYAEYVLVNAADSYYRQSGEDTIATIKERLADATEAEKAAVVAALPAKKPPKEPKEVKVK